MMQRKRWSILVTCAAMTACSGGGSGGVGATSGDTTFALTDAPRDDLSVLQVDVLSLDVRDVTGQTTRVFPSVATPSFSVNLLRLEDAHVLLGSSSLPAGSYDRLELAYTNAVAVDDQGNPLNVNSGASGLVPISFSTPIALGSQPALLEFDFDVDRSVKNLVKGPGGSLDLAPTIVVELDDGSRGQNIDDFEGRVTAVRSGELTLSLGLGSVRVSLDPSAVVRAGGARVTAASGPIDLTTLIGVGDDVEVDGRYQAASNTIVATRVEVEDGLSGLRGPELRGVVVGVGAGGVSLRVTESRAGSIAAGSVQTVGFDAMTQFEYDDPDGPASSSAIKLGQSLRTTGAAGSALLALEVKLRSTELRGQVVSVDSTALRAVLDVTDVEGLSVASIPGFVATITARFAGAIPSGVTVGASVELDGHFERSAVGVFDVVEVEQDDDDEDSIEGTQFAMVGTSASFRAMVTGELELGATVTNGATVDVLLAANATLVEKSDATGALTIIDRATLEAGINSGRYSELEAEGVYDAVSNTLSAIEVEVEAP